VRRSSPATARFCARSAVPAVGGLLRVGAEEGEDVGRDRAGARIERAEGVERPLDLAAQQQALALDVVARQQIELLLSPIIVVAHRVAILERQPVEVAAARTRARASPDTAPPARASSASCAFAKAGSAMRSVQ